MKIGITCWSLRDHFAAMLASRILQKWPEDGIYGLRIRRSFTRIVADEIDKHGWTGLLRSVLAHAGFHPNVAGNDENTIALRQFDGFAEEHGLTKWKSALLRTGDRVTTHAFRSLDEDGLSGFVKEEGVEILINAGGGIFRDKLINSVQLGILNAHMGSLPGYRGMNAIEWTILHGGSPSVTLHYVDSGIDTGDILLSRANPVHKGDTIESLRARFYRIAVDAIIDGLNVIREGKVRRIRQVREDGRQYYTMHPALLEIVKHRLERLTGQTPPLRILTISNLYPRPDKPTYGIFNQQLFDSLADFGCEVTNWCLVPEFNVLKWPGIREWKSPQAARSGLRTEYKPVWYMPVLGRSLNSWTYRKSLSRIKSQASNTDVVFSTWLYPDGVAATQFAWEAGKPAWIMVQGSDTSHLESPLRRRVILDACGKAAGIICVWKGLAERLISVGVDAKKIHVVPNGVDGELFRYRTKEEAGKKLSVISHQWSSKIVLFVGNLVPVKGPDILLEAWACMKSNCRMPNNAPGKSDCSSNVSTPILTRVAAKPPGEAGHSHTHTLLIIGSGPMRAALERRARKLGIGDSVVFLGSRPHEEVALWMNIADCLCLPSRSEGMPNVVIEAVSSGLPVVASEVGGCREVLAEEVAACRLAPAGESKAFSDALRDLIEVDTNRAGMAARQSARYSWKQQAGEILRLMNLTNQQLGNAAAVAHQ
jgi:teichuronic acid biosynthesis glycosyltransferase TuaC